MSMFDKSTLYKTRCPDCGGKVYRDYFGGDCRGNPPSRKIWCKKCEREFTQVEWDEIEKKAKEKEPEKVESKSRKKKSMAPRPKKPRRKSHKVKNYEFGKEIEISPENQPISWRELKEIVEREFAGWPSENLLVMVPGPCPLVIETEQKRIK